MSMIFENDECVFYLKLENSMFCNCLFIPIIWTLSLFHNLLTWNTNIPTLNYQTEYTKHNLKS